MFPYTFCDTYNSKHAFLPKKKKEYSPSNCKVVTNTLLPSKLHSPMPVDNGMDFKHRLESNFV